MRKLALGNVISNQCHNFQIANFFFFFSEIYTPHYMTAVKKNDKNIVLHYAHVRMLAPSFNFIYILDFMVFLPFSFLTVPDGVRNLSTNICMRDDGGRGPG